MIETSNNLKVSSALSDFTYDNAISDDHAGMDYVFAINERLDEELTDEETAEILEDIAREQDRHQKAPQVLIACESSGEVRRAFQRIFRYGKFVSCDLLPADDEQEKAHIQGDAIEAIKSHNWDLVIAFPPCTHLASSGARWFAQKRADGRQQEGIDFFMGVINACEEIGAKWAVENPVGIMSTQYRKPNQIIQPWQYGHGETKATCLWLSGLPELIPTDIVEGREQRIWKMPPSADRWKERSKTYEGIARAMADQWSKVIDRPYEV
jgi:site-specific DNA-cytosine methylase